MDVLLIFLFVRGGPAPNSRHRVTITPAKQNKAKKALLTGQEKTRPQKHQSMTWAQRLKRVFGIDIETCEQCGGARLWRASTNRQESRFAQRMLPEGLGTRMCLMNIHWSSKRYSVI
jgi:hypothetical protein